MYKILVLISKSTMFHKISSFAKPCTKKASSFVSMVHIKTQSTLIAMQTNTTFTAHVSSIFLADFASPFCG